MDTLEYLVGKCVVCAANLNTFGHQFLVTAECNKVTIYVGEALNHEAMLELTEFKDELQGKEIVGGGAFEILGRCKLFLWGSSGRYQAIPNYAARRFGEKLIFHLHDQLAEASFDLTDVRTATLETTLNPFWKKYGFKPVPVCDSIHNHQKQNPSASIILPGKAYGTVF